VRNVDINLGKACNNRCRFCSNGEPMREELRWGELEAIEAEIARRRVDGAESIGFLGGEPTLYPHLERVVNVARAQGYRRVSLCTNGSRLADPALLEHLLDAGVTRVAVSIHSHLEKVEDFITRRPGAFQQKIEALRNLVSARRAGRLPDGLSLNTVLHRKNVELLEEFTRFMGGIGVDSIRFNFIRPSHLAERSKAWIPRFNLVTPAVMQVVARNEAELHLSINFADIPLCKFPWAVLVEPGLRSRYVGEGWDMQTDVSMTWRHERKEMSARAARFSWQERRLEFKSFLPTCEPCVLKDRCEGIWTKYLELYGSREFLPGAALVAACVRA
jgi:sulfatase maturation enzyme AslB (radical SAM superfamily)